MVSALLPAKSLSVKSSLSLSCTGSTGVCGDSLFSGFHEVGGVCRLLNV